MVQSMTPEATPTPASNAVSAGATVPWPAEVVLRREAESQRLDWPTIARHLHSDGLSLDLETPPRQLAGGLANLNFLLRVNGGWMVLRRPPAGRLPPGANDMRREHRILSRLWRALPLAPKSYHLCEDVEVAGAPFQLLEFRSGLVFRGDRPDQLPATDAVGRLLSDMLIETLATIHTVDLSTVGLGDLGRPQGFFRRSAKGWINRGTLAAGGSLCLAGRDIARWLEQSPDPASATATLLHNDFKLDN